MTRWRALIFIFVPLLLCFVLIPTAFADSTYVVKPGENLFRIALNHGLTTQQLAQANGILNPTLIYAGQVLTIPDAGQDESSPPPAPAQPAAPAPSATTYTVQRGDILSRIALRYGLPVQVIAQANGITNPSFIYAGQVLTIPAGGNSDSGAGASPPAPAPPPAPAVGQGLGERWIDIDLTNQRLTAYEGNQAVFSTAISSGTWAHPTVTGQFHIWLRYESQTMDGRRLGYNYYLPNVPYVMYFYRDYALHGTYWHNNFGTPMSHGCVNMTIDDARWLYYWSSYGTMVNVHY